MKKADIVKLVEDAGVDKELRKMVLGYVNLAHDAGFQEGLTAGAKIQSQVFDMLMNPKKGK